MERHLALAAGCMALILSACGASGSSKASSAPSKPATPATDDQGASATAAGPGTPCRLVSEADVEAAVGADVRQSGSTDTSTGKGCSFALASASDQNVFVVATNPANSAAAFDAAKANAAVEPIAGLGDRAFVLGGRAVVQKGSTLLVVIVGLKQSPSSLAAAARKLAQSAAPRI